MQQSPGLVGMVCKGEISTSDLTEVLDSRRPDLQSLYDALAAAKGPKAPRKIVNASYDIANIWAGTIDSTGRTVVFRNARPLMQQVLGSLDRPL